MGKFNGFNTGASNMQGLMRQAQRMQQEVARVQEEVGNTDFEASVEAVRLANETMEKEMSKVTGGLGNLGGFGF